jgi:hypothetical protein
LIMSRLRRRYLGPLALILASLAGLLLWLRYWAPDPLHHAIARSHAVGGSGATLASLVRHLTDLVALALDVVAYGVGLLLLMALLLAVVRIRARARRAQIDQSSIAELRLGRDDQASPYEISKVFDGIAGALRPGMIARALRGPPTLTLKIASAGGSQPVRFLVQAPRIYHAAIGARLRATYPDSRLVPVEEHGDDPLALMQTCSPVAAARALTRGGRIPRVAAEVLRVKKARRWVWALATTKDYEHSLI